MIGNFLYQRTFTLAGEFNLWKNNNISQLLSTRHEHLYHTLSSHVVRSDNIKKAVQELKGVKVILSTLSMLSNPRIDLITAKVPVKFMVVDEASQIAVSDYIAPLEYFKTLQKICFIGDDRQCELNYFFSQKHIETFIKCLPMGRMRLKIYRASLKSLTSVNKPNFLIFNVSSKFRFKILIG
jgi:hypothetical protein